MRHLFHSPIRTITGYDGIPAEILGLFSQLTAELSPENLSCDGELSRAQVNARYRDLTKKWKALETYVGRPVSEDEVWKHLRTQEAELQLELDKCIELASADGDAQAQMNGTMNVVSGVAYTVETRVKVQDSQARLGPESLGKALKDILAPLAFLGRNRVTFTVTVGPDKPAED